MNLWPLEFDPDLAKILKVPDWSSNPASEEGEEDDGLDIEWWNIGDLTEEEKEELAEAFRGRIIRDSDTSEDEGDPKKAYDEAMKGI